jgi:hypothetical protein
MIHTVKYAFINIRANDRREIREFAIASRTLKIIMIRDLNV